jgi:Flp pilus assembly protein CpaB
MILMVVAVACGLGASYMTSKLLAERNKEQTEETVPVLVAKVRIAAWQPIKDPESVFEIKQFPASVAPPKALADLDKVKDQRLNKLIEAGKPVTEGDLLTKEQQGLAEQLKPGQRAVSIKVTTESTVSGFVLPGTRVDVICTTRGNNASARVLLQHMLVLAVDTASERPTETRTIVGQNVTLAATTEEALRLSLAASTGDLRLLLKDGSETKRTANRVIRLDDLDKPAYSGSEKEEDAARSTPTPPVVVPTGLPPVEPKEVARVEPPKAKEKKRKRHVMTLITGSNVEKIIFDQSKDEDDETTTASSPLPKKDKEESKVEKPAEKKPTSPQPPVPPPPTSPFGKSVRTGRIK